MIVNSIRVWTRVSFEQQPNADFPARTRTLIYRFLNEYEATDDWQSLTDTCRITLPKNVYVRDITGRLVSLVGPNINIGGFGTNDPLFMRGDKVKLEVGYRFKADNSLKEMLQTATVFEGFVTKVGSRKPIVLECEDNMYALKQVLAPNKTYGAGVPLESVVKDMIAGTGFTVNVLTETTLGTFSTHNETVAEVLARIGKDYHFFAYFRGTELRVGSQVYIEQDAIAAGRKVFEFQGNIISDDLTYNRTEDIELSAVAYSINKIELATATRRGGHRTKHKRLEALVTIRNGKVTSYARLDNDRRTDFAPNVNGERRTLYFWDVQTTEKLVELAANELKKYYYKGMRGKFITFGLPFVQQGDNIDIIDPALPERNGRYKVRSVRYYGGVSAGLRQEIELDYLITKINAQGDAIS